MPDAKEALRKRFESRGRPRCTIFARDTRVTHGRGGPARIDAIGLIVNRLTATLPDFPRTGRRRLRQSSLPSYGILRKDCGRSGAALQQDPIFRNLTETMGVFMPIDLQSKSPAEGLFHSNAAIARPPAVENQLARLAPPQWPEEVFGRIDRDKAKAGKALFMTNCASCHNAWPYTWTEPNKYGKRFVLVGVIPQSYVGTDPGQFHDRAALAQ